MTTDPISAPLAVIGTGSLEAAAESRLEWPLHILLTVNSAWNAWNFRRALIRAFIDDGHSVTIAAPADEAVGQLEALGCKFVELRMDPRAMGISSALKALWEFGRLFASERPDVVLSYTIKNNVFGALASRGRGIAFIPTVTGLGTAFLSGRLLRLISEFLYRYAFRTLPIVIFQNSDDEKMFVARKLVRSEQTLLVPGSGVDLEHFSPAEFPPASHPPTFLMISRLLRDKGVLEFVEAAKNVKSRYPNARFQLLGPIDDRNRSAVDRQTIESWQESGAVEYLGTTTDVRPHIAAAHCIVLPSYREGAPRTLIEAAAMARPVIATNVAGCRSVVDHEINGFLCEARSAESLSRAMLSFLDLPHDLRTKMGEAGRAKIQREFDEALVMATYRNAIATASRRRRLRRPTRRSTEPTSSTHERT